MRPDLVLRVGAGVARAELRRKGIALWAGEVTFADASELGIVLTQLLAGEALPRRPGRLLVEVEAPLAQVRSLRGLPPVSSAQLRALVATQSGRFFRRNGKPLVTDAAWDGRSGKDRVAVAAALEEPWLEAIVEAAREAAVPLHDVRPATLPPGVRLRLISPAERARRRRSDLLAVRRLALLAAVIWVAAAATVAGRVRAERKRIDREIARIDAPTAALIQAGRALDSASLMVRALADAERDHGRVLACLTAISAALPDSAFVTSLTVDARGRGEIVVVARRSAEVLAALDHEAGVVSPELRGGIARESSGGREWERFTVSFGGGVAR